MSTYEEFMVILTVALLIVAILNLKKRNSCPDFGKQTAISWVDISPGRVKCSHPPTSLLSILYTMETHFATAIKKPVRSITERLQRH